MYIDIRVGSITNAQRGLGILKSNGYKSTISKLESPSKADGCGYVIRVSANTKEPIRILERKGLKINGVDYK